MSRKHDLECVLTKFLVTPEGNKRERAKDEATKAYDYLVSRTIRKCFPTLPSGIESDDIVQQGRLALAKALELFDPSRGTAFITYTIGAIENEVRKHVRKQSRCKSGRSKEWKLYNTVAELTQAYGREPTTDEIAHSLGLTLEEYSEYTRSVELNYPYSIQQSVRSNYSGDGEEITLADVLNDGTSVHNTAILREQARVIREFAKGLPEDLRITAELMFDGYKAKGIAEELEISVSQATARVNAVMRRVRCALNKGSSRELFDEQFTTLTEKRKNRKRPNSNQDAV